ncbi:glycosyltransferase [Chimaeribacter arupi]|uniref:glycosyltransferase n=1 Tax=Chimaeribacter arupi TaxID=2060066 RepID=UPI000C7DB933|nr:glycosyltransferase [Chimaeribacter arupi]PLR29781.1 glycosyl transferase family 2 [Chimaeribacter arupi]
MKITALIVTFNRLEKLKQCWKETQNLPFDDILIVNNASTDQTAVWLDSLEDKRLHTLSLKENTGGAGGFKRGAEYIDKYIDTDWIFIYDDDAYPDQSILSEFNSLDLKHYIALQCRVIDRAGNECKMNQPFIKIPLTLLDNIDYILNSGKYTINPLLTSECVTLSFVGTIIRKDIFCKQKEDIHSELFIYYDDVFFSHHLKLAGYDFLYVPQLLFRHDISIVNRSISPAWKVYYLVRNLIISRKIFKHQSPYSLISIFLRIAKIFMVTPYQEDKKTYLQYIYKAIVDGVSGKTGKRH